MQVKKIRAVRRPDLAQVIEIDARITGLAKPGYWAQVLGRYGGRGAQGCFLVCVSGKRVEGYIVGEVRDWEFGAPPCGWVFAIGVRPAARLAGLGTALLEAVCARFRARGVDKVRSLLARDNALVLAFFRSQGMMAAPLIALQKDLE
jgi:ribosomal protein S18 acetylase RimI-like enzyme